jgi:hypothetical protein
MLKVIVGVLVLGGIGLAIAYYVGGAGSFDPTAQGRKVRAAITPGMTWQQVINVAGEPGKYQTILPKKHGGTPEPGALVRFDRNSLVQELATNVHQYGFVFPYTFSEARRFLVYSDPKGVVEYVADAVSMADLLDTRRP